MENCRIVKKNSKGITLIALVITIIVLLILAAITLNLILGENGIISKSKDAKDEHILSEIKDEIMLAWGSVQMDAYTTNDRYFDQASELQQELRKKDKKATVSDDADKLDVYYREYETQLDPITGEINKPKETIQLSEIQWKEIQHDNGMAVGIDINGKLYTWGDNFWGGLGTGNPNGNAMPQYPICLTDKDDNLLYGKTFEKVFVNGTIMAIDSNGDLYGWGCNYSGSLGDGRIQDEYNSPIYINNPIIKNMQIKDIFLTLDNVVILDKQDKVYVIGGLTKDTTPICISDIEGSTIKNVKIKDISIYEDSNEMILLDEQGKAYIWPEGSEIPSKNKGRCISNDNNSPLYGKIVEKREQTRNKILFSTKDSKIYELDYNGTLKCINEETNSVLYNKKVKQLTERFLLDTDGKVYTSQNDVYEELENKYTELQDKKIIQINEQCLLDDNNTIYYIGEEYNEEIQEYEEKCWVIDLKKDLGMKDAKIKEMKIANRENSEYLLVIDEQNYAYAMGMLSYGR